MDQLEFEELLEKYLRGETSALENKIIDEWFSLIEDEGPVLSKREWASLGQRLQERLEVHKIKSTSNTSLVVESYSWVWKVAASISVIILLAGLIFLNPFSDSDLAGWHVIENAGQKDKVIVLDDGTMISLKKGSSLKYPEAFDGETREVILSKGAAFFQVKRDVRHPFIVLSKNVKTRVLGTSFNIYSDEEGRVVVSVKSGKVEVSTSDAHQKQPKVYLTANQEVDYNPQTNEVVASIVEKPAPLVTKEDLKNYVFSKTPVSEIFKDMEKVYGIKISFNESKLSQCLLTTYLDSDEDLFERLDIICKAIGAAYSVDGLNITVSGSGC